MTRTEMRPAVRERLLREMLRELGAKGREGISVAAVLADLEVPAEEFVAEFADLDSCLDLAYEELAEQVFAAVRFGCVAGAARGEEARWPERVRDGLEALLATLAADPLRARTLILAYPSSGVAARARYQSFLDRFAALLAPGRELSEVGADLPTAVEALAVGAIEAILFEEISARRTSGLPALLPSLLFSLLVPFLGPVEAAAEMERARRRR